MKKINVQQITVPLDFKVACGFYKIDIAEVLQIFIDHVTIYDTINKSYHEGFSEASHAIVYYVKAKASKTIKSKAIKKCWRLVEQNIKQIVILAEMRKKGWKTTTKRGYTRCFVENIFKSMERLHTPSDILYLDEFSTLRLSKDFCVLCELHNCYPKEFLEYFMGRISLADAHAHLQLKKWYGNFIFDFLFKIADGFGRDTTSIPSLNDVELHFYQRVKQLRLELYIIQDLKERAAILRDFYLSHYRTMNPN